MKWYDLFSNFYDSSLEKLYFESRKRAVQLLDIKDQQQVLDVACGTGANFKHLLACEKEISIYATDFSAGMLSKAKSLKEKNKWNNIHLFQADARRLSANQIEQYIGKDIRFDRIICVLGLSVIPEWEQVISNLLTLLKEDGKIVIVDVFADKRTFNTWLVEKIAKADLNREIWQTLRQKTTEFYEYLPVSEKKVGGKLFVAVGKPSKNPN